MVSAIRTNAVHIASAQTDLTLCIGQSCSGSGKILKDLKKKIECVYEFFLKTTNIKGVDGKGHLPRLRIE